MIRPRFLQIGDTIGITCPARKVALEEIQIAIQILESWGLKVVLGSTIGKANHQFGGTDKERLDDLQNMLNNPDIRAIIAARGGYGTVRIIDQLNFNTFMEQPKWLIGFSDFTYLHTVLNSNIGIETIHGIMPITFEKSTPEALESLRKCLFGESLEYHFSSHKLNRPGTIEGEIVGGNLSILYSLLGTKTIVNTSNSILFIEDLDEYLYHIDRMMMALKRANKLSNLRGLIVGGMTEMKDNTIPYGKTAEEIILEHVAEYNYPVCFDFPAGHIEDNRSILMGKKAKLFVQKDKCIFNQ
ncbi:MAG TPA: LD-carboxypeptidase [Chitinophagales bacterium]|nr:LD-carboxypeptidase [Chitinophagales bacterium]MCB0512410.1 LD-carboxypeptidase [Bacteroidota bacterium]HMU97601.1 LD-carboxypeptidase [Chitinophagales bacterium]HMV03582.1 LD-carboxypeptidase [Chitinophagales bacterium]HMW94243.1 LD-carboxypeptidase [Chitinophagales bacterium]